MRIFYKGKAGLPLRLHAEPHSQAHGLDMFFFYIVNNIHLPTAAKYPFWQILWNLFFALSRFNFAHYKLKTQPLL